MPFGALVTILRQTGGIPGRPAGMMPCTYNDLSFMNPSSGWLTTVQAGACGTWVSAAFLHVTDIPGLRQSRVSGCRGRRGSSRLRRRAELALEAPGRLASGIYHKDGSVPGLTQESLVGRRSCAGLLGCWVGASEGGTKLKMKPMRDRPTTACCLPFQAGMYGYASGIVVPLKWQSACHRGH